jgi:hypothetical protein
VHAITRCELRAAMRCKYYVDTVNPKRSYPEWVISVNFVMSAKVNDTDVAALGRHQGGPQRSSTPVRCDPESEHVGVEDIEAYLSARLHHQDIAFK